MEEMKMIDKYRNIINLLGACTLGSRCGRWVEAPESYISEVHVLLGPPHVLRE